MAALRTGLRPRSVALDRGISSLSEKVDAVSAVKRLLVAAGIS